MPKKYPAQGGQEPLWGGSTSTPHVDPPGYNIHGPTQASTSPPRNFRMRNAVEGATQRFINAGGIEAINAKFPMPKMTPLQEAAAAAAPKTTSAAVGVAWAFRGNRTARTQSLYREQNLYGGVQRDLMPTERISMRKIGLPSMTDTERQRERQMLDYQELALPVAGAPGSYGAGAAPPLPEMVTGSSPMSGLHRTSPVEGSEDVLFQQNTGSGIGVNPFGLTPHQRATMGVRPPGS